MGGGGEPIYTCIGNGAFSVDQMYEGMMKYTSLHCFSRGGNVGHGHQVGMFDADCCAHMIVL